MKFFVKRKSSSLDDRKLELEAFQHNWVKLADAAGVPGMALADMTAWVSKRDEVLSQHATLELHREDLAAIQQTCADATAELIEALKTVSITYSSQDLPALIAAAESFVLEAERALAREESLNEQQVLAERAQTEAQSKLVTTR